MAARRRLFEVPLPAVVSVKEGINLPRYPSLPGRLRAKRAEITVLRPQWQADGLRKVGLRVPESPAQRAKSSARELRRCPS